MGTGYFQVSFITLCFSSVLHRIHRSPLVFFSASSIVSKTQDGGKLRNDRWSILLTVGFVQPGSVWSPCCSVRLILAPAPSLA